MDTPIPEFLAEAANKRVSDIFIIAGRPLAEKIDGHLFSSGDRLMPAETEALLRTIYTLAENRDISRLLETGDDDFSFSIPGVSRFRVNAYKQRGSLGCRDPCDRLPAAGSCRAFHSGRCDECF